MEIQTVSGARVKPWLNAVATLRTEVFRDFPYLYDGELDYERRYLMTYAQSPGSLFVLALDGNRVVGASTGLPLTDAEAEFQTPFIAQGIALDSVFYFGESVLQRGYRGHGIGHRFFDEREKFARSLGKTVTAFCAVERPDNHPLKPADYTPLDQFWQQRGYTKQATMRTAYAWKDIDQTATTEKPMVFWLKKWNST
ncbi:MAG TPA: GNAT family N-acetyltransferase [Pseudomonadales bacterium]|nr:GNAT family N-acetyltransferase [Pseudomonadales bacterium]